MMKYLFSERIKVTKQNKLLKIANVILCRCSFKYDLYFNGSALQSGVKFTAVE